MPNPFRRRVFLSSTVYDLETERDLVQRTLEAHSEDVCFECIRSDGDSPRFLIGPTDLAAKHSYDVCIDKVAECDYFVLLVNARYGRPQVHHKGESISITHREYREAYAKRLPLFSFVNVLTWNARHALKTTGSQSYVADDQLGVFMLIDEITRSPRANWIERYTKPDDIVPYLRNYLLGFDDSRFVADVTVPDGDRILVDTEFEKTWEIENNGCIAWRDRFLQVQNALASGITPAEDTVPIPKTRPGERVRISVRLRTPKYPATCESYWKMIDSSGKLCFPKKKGVFCRIQVIDR